MISQDLLDYKPKSIYFKQRWGAALAWVEAQNKDGRVRNSGGVGDGRGRRQVPANVERQAKTVQVRGEIGGLATEMQRLRRPESPETTGGILQKAA
jgi:hypothetical protein